MEPTPLQLVQQEAARKAVLRAAASVGGPKDGIVAVKVSSPVAAALSLSPFMNLSMPIDGPCKNIKSNQLLQSLLYGKNVLEVGNVSECLVAYDQVQYPDALPTMLTDLRSIRQWAGYLQKTEIKFDMVSAVDELAKQVICQHPAI